MFYIPLEPAHLMIARACLSVLLHLDGSVSKATIKNLPLVFFAARYWQSHTKFGNVSLRVQDAIRQVFDPNEPYFSAWSWLRNDDEHRESISDTPSTPTTPPLHRAAENDLGDVVEWLITSRSQDPDQLEPEFVSFRTTPLFYASTQGNLKVAQLLIKHGADVNAQHSVGWRPLHTASYHGHLEILRFLIRSGADVNSREPNNLAPLHLASEYGHLEVVRALLESGADPNVWSWDGTPLFEALKFGRLEIVPLLLEYGADINAADQFGGTLLHLASRTGSREVAERLLEHGAKIHARNCAGERPLQVASAGNRQDIVQLLLQHGAEGS